MADIDLSRAPTGVLAAEPLIAAVAELGDRAERHYLEVKSEVDLSTKRDKEKIAKFILGAANRMPDVAMAAFEGYAAMIIGVSKDEVRGIAPAEMLDIAHVVQQYLGAAGPKWDVIWVPIEGSTKQVLIVTVEPPCMGQGPFPCRSSGETLTNGRIYIRAEGETREANAEELDLLVARGRALPRTKVDFAIEVTGDLAPFFIDKRSTADEYTSGIRKRLISALPVETAAATGEGGTALQQTSRTFASAIALSQSLTSPLSEPERRSRNEYVESIDTWESEFRRAWAERQVAYAVAQLEPATVRVTNRTQTFFHDVELHLHLEGDISAYAYQDPARISEPADLDLPAPPRKWGPKPFSLGTLMPSALRHFPNPTGGFTARSIRYRNDGSVTLSLRIRELRPLGEFESEHDELALIIGETHPSTIRGTWRLTASGHNELYTGEVELDVMPVKDLTDGMRRFLGLTAANDTKREGR